MANQQRRLMAKVTGEMVKFTLTAMSQGLKGVKQRAKAMEIALAMAKANGQRPGINQKGAAQNVYIAQKKDVGRSDVQL